MVVASRAQVVVSDWLHRLLDGFLLTTFATVSILHQFEKCQVQSPLMFVSYILCWGPAAVWMWGYTQTTNSQTPRPIQFLSLCSGYIPIITRYLLMRCRHNTESCSCLEAWSSLDSSVLNTQILPDCVPSSTYSAVTCSTHRMRPSRNMVPMPWTHTGTRDRTSEWGKRHDGVEEEALVLTAHSLSIPLLCISHLHRMTIHIFNRHSFHCRLWCGKPLCYDPGRLTVMQWMNERLATLCIGNTQAISGWFVS